MLKTLKQQQGIILAAVAALAVVVAAGYFSAVKRSEPKYRNKVEEMMFEEGNKSPKYVITLPDKIRPQGARSTEFLPGCRRFQKFRH